MTQTTKLKCDNCKTGVVELKVKKTGGKVDVSAKACNVCKKSFGIFSLGGLAITVKRAIALEINKTEAKLKKLRVAYEKADDGFICRECLNCKTENYMYYADTDTWTCAYCG